MLRLPFGSNVRGKKTPKLAKSPFLSLEDDPGTSGRKLEKARPAETGLAPQSELHLQITSKASRKEELESQMKHLKYERERVQQEYVHAVEKRNEAAAEAMQAESLVFDAAWTIEELQARVSASRNVVEQLEESVHNLLITLEHGKKEHELALESFIEVSNNLQQEHRHIRKDCPHSLLKEAGYTSGHSAQEK